MLTIGPWKTKNGGQLKTVVFERKSDAFEHERGIDEIEPVCLEVRSALCLRPGELHAPQCIYGE